MLYLIFSSCFTVCKGVPPYLPHLNESNFPNLCFFVFCYLWPHEPRLVSFYLVFDIDIGPRSQKWNQCFRRDKDVLLNRIASNGFNLTIFSKKIFGFAAESSISPVERSAVDTSTESHYCRRSQITAVFLAKFS